MHSFFDTDAQTANKTLGKLLEALENKDEDAIKSMFSKQALDEADDFNRSVDYLFDFFQGTVESYGWRNNTGGPISDVTIEKGKKQVELKSWFNVTTDQEKYIFFLLDYPKDTINKDNVGLYALRVVKAEDENTQLTYWQDMKIPGIYNPNN